MLRSRGRRPQQPRASVTSTPSSIRVDPRWQAFPGVAHGLRQPILRGKLDVVIPGGYDFAALDEVMEPLFDERLAPPPQLSNAAESLVHRLLHWQAAAQRQQMIPVFGAYRIVSARHSTGASQFEVALPYHAPLATQQALTWVAGRLNELLNLSDVTAHATRIAGGFEELLERLRKYALAGINNFHLLRASHDLDIPARAVIADTYCFGYGANSRWLNSTQTDQTSVIGVTIAASKSRTARVLRLSGVPVPRHSVAHDEQHALQLAREIGYPVVVKPDDLEQGRGVAAGLRDDAALVAAYRGARSHSKNILVEKHHDGEDYRLTVLKDQVVKILHRRAGGVAGDGVHTIADLVALQQETPRFKNKMRQTGKALLDLDDEALGLLAERRLSPDSVPAAGDFVVMRRKSNISAGGIQTLIPLEHAHPDNIGLAVRSTRAVQLDVCGVDLLVPDISKSWLETGAVIIDMNARPQVGYSLAPEVYALMLRQLLNGDGRIPVHLLLCATSSDSPGTQASLDLMQSSTCNGMATAEGVWVNGRKVCGADNGFQAARILLLDKAVTGALCIVTAQDILRDGLPADRFDRVIVAGRRPARGHDKVALGMSLAMLEGGRIGSMADLPAP